MHTLFDAIEYVLTYPHACNEQKSTKLLVFAALYDVIKQFKPTESESKVYLVNTITTNASRNLRNLSQKD